MTMTKSKESSSMSLVSIKFNNISLKFFHKKLFLTNKQS